MSLTAALGSEGSGAPFTWKGRLYYLMPVDIGIEQAFTAWCIERGAAPLIAAKATLDPEDYAAALANYYATAPHRFSFWGREATKIRQTLEGMVKMYQLLLSVRHRGISEKTVREMIKDVGEEMGAAARTFFPKTSDAEGVDPEATEENTPTDLNLEILTPEKVDLMRGRTATT